MKSFLSQAWDFVIRYNSHESSYEEHESSQLTKHTDHEIDKTYRDR